MCITFSHWVNSGDWWRYTIGLDFFYLKPEAYMGQYTEKPNRYRDIWKYQHSEYLNILEKIPTKILKKRHQLQNQHDYYITIPPL